MNFLAHLHLADHCHSHLAGNLLADFVRGDPYRQYSPEVAAGIKLHRFVDGFIDSQPEVRAWRRAFPPDIRRVSGIALDMIWDHYLARHWHNFHDLPLPVFVQQVRKEVEGFAGKEPDHYRQMTQHMWQQEWLIQYQQVASIHQALERMAIRRPKLSSLAECPPFLAGHYQELEQSFFILYPRLMDASQAFWRAHKAVLLGPESAE
ncbi:ACP phosphodiesterase [Photobacterium halotolerans]|uniref:acyl carrier protein phosphodiesterase n=1 Tax=Photobacterium halotolerans TaxID=265726 RepID=UPI00047F3253|nr:ACP phosphodiesterase [Photobacterium halotolerans]